jgi:ATP-binding cassette subfamily C (CFTR/MRP) protein 1
MSRDASTDQLVTKKSRYSLFLVSISTLKWQLLVVIPPRACLIALTFVQPLMINRAVLLAMVSDNNVTPWSTQVGYGLIGAYAMVYIGAAVCIGTFVRPGWH